MVIFSTFKVLKNPMQFCPKRGEKKKRNAAMKELWILSCLRGSKVNNFRERRRAIETQSHWANSLFQPKVTKKISAPNKRVGIKMKIKGNKAASLFMMFSGRLGRSGETVDILLFHSVETQQGSLSDIYSGEEISSQNLKYKPSPRPTAKQD